MEWRDIESAPTDRDVLFSDGKSVVQGWMLNGKPHIGRDLTFDGATYWMPLPPLPERKG